MGVDAWSRRPRFGAAHHGIERVDDILAGAGLHGLGPGVSEFEGGAQQLSYNFV